MGKVLAAMWLGKVVKFFVTTCRKEMLQKVLATRWLEGDEDLR
jgi:hypothetical protein